MTAPISDPQLKYISDLVVKHDMSGLSAEEQAFFKTPAVWPHLNMDQASKAIQALLACPKLATHKPANDGAPVQGFSGGPVPDPGYYFIVDPTSGKESFFRVTKGKDRWEGYTFLAIQASDDWYPIKDQERRQKVYDTILVDPINAMNEYGQRIGKCGVCGRTLTDRDSRLRGIGPVCAERILGAPSEEDLNILKSLGLM